MPHPKGRKGEIVANIKKWNLEQIITFWGRTCPKMPLSKTIDIFADSVENYKDCNYSQKLYFVANTFILAANVMRVDFLTGSQAMEVANNLATDFGADKTKVQNQINKIMKENERKYNVKRFNI